MVKILIDRQEALSYSCDKENASADFVEGFESYKEWLEKLPTTQLVYEGTNVYEVRNWIPVSERLPEKSTWVLVTRKRLDGYVYQDIALINKYTGLWESDDESFCDTVIAWMPLPKPYKTESE